ncbi:MAG: Holliday junction resolvase RuvX [Fimbriimonadales bacterium]|nr:Holliday junction resolvase RuvX [Fimbriimonadales bacterium]
MKVIGIDYGTKRIGIAVAETQLGLAFARPVMDSKGSTEADAKAIAELAREEECGLVVVGLPLTPSGEEGEQAAISREFGNALANEGVSVHFADERYTTALANVALEHLKSRKRKLLADSEAARILLIQYLSERHA